MNETIIPLDVEMLLAEELKSAEIDARPIPFPDDLGKTLPIVIVMVTGGRRLNVVMDEHDAPFDVYAATVSAALDQARIAFGVIASLTVNGINDWRRVDMVNTPYVNPDPSHPTLARVSFEASVASRAAITTR